MTKKVSAEKVKQLVAEATKYWPEMHEELIAALTDYELEMRKATEEAFAMGVEHGMKLAREEDKR